MIESSMFEKNLAFSSYCDDVFVIDNLKNIEARFFVSTIPYSDGHPSWVSNPE